MPCDACPINIDLNVKAGKIEGVFTTLGYPKLFLAMPRPNFRDDEPDDY